MTWASCVACVPVSDLRPSPTDDEGGPGDTPASAHFLEHEQERRVALAALSGSGKDAE